MDKDSYFHIISNDQGFDPLIAHLKQERMFADRVTEIAAIPAIVQANAISKTPDGRVRENGRRIEYSDEA